MTVRIVSVEMTTSVDPNFQVGLVLEPNQFDVGVFNKKMLYMVLPDHEKE